ncbi:MAG: TetR/AcrR family transcriptional regulator [Synergistales bacterium]|nr:TetR/AcrR family transcriptional regulator [Synergistales bacterium]
MIGIRDREGTKKKILKAVGHILKTRGFQDIGINNIARESGVDKVLIYRYFGGLQELLHAFAEQGDYWPTTNDIAPEDDKNIKNLAIPEASIVLLRGYLRELKKNPSAQEILRGELMSKNELALETAGTREKQGRDLINLLDLEPGLRDRIDVTAVAALLSAGFTYLILRSKTSGTYLGLDLNSEDDWERIENALDQLVRSVFDHDLKFS